MTGCNVLAISESCRKQDAKEKGVQKVRRTNSPVCTNSLRTHSRFVHERGQPNNLDAFLEQIPYLVRNGRNDAVNLPPPARSNRDQNAYHTPLLNHSRDVRQRQVGIGNAVQHGVDVSLAGREEGEDVLDDGWGGVRHRVRRTERGQVSVVFLRCDCDDALVSRHSEDLFPQNPDLVPILREGGNKQKEEDGRTWMA